MPALRHDDVLLRLTKEMIQVRAALRSIVGNIPLFDLSSENTPAQITGNQNNYAIGDYDILRISSDAARTITGLAEGLRGRYLRLFNVGAFTITLSHQSGSSSVANRFKFSAAVDFSLDPGASVLVYYDDVQSRWIDAGGAAGAGGCRLCLEAAADYYVRTDGNDTNDGSANDAAHAFLTIQHAINIVAGTVDTVFYDVTIHVAAGAYAEDLTAKQCVGGGEIIIVGDETTPANVTTGGLYSDGISTVYHLRGFTVFDAAPNDSGIEATNGATIKFQHVAFSTSAAYQVRATNLGSVVATDDYSIVGNAVYHVDVINNGVFVAYNMDVTLVGARAYTTFARTRIGGVLQFSSNVFVGAATGKRYDVQSNAVLYTAGGGAGYLPGNAAGTTATGGVYI